MGKAAIGKSAGAGTTGRMLALSAAVLVVVVALAALLVSVSSPAAPASSGGVGENPRPWAQEASTTGKGGTTTDGSDTLGELCVTTCLAGYADR